MTGDVFVADPTEWVRTAARRTLDSGSARVWHAGQSVPEPRPGRSLISMSEGVADLARGRLRVSIEPGPGWQHVIDLLLERFPWLDDGDEDEGEGEDPEAFAVYAGTAQYFGSDENWSQPTKGDPIATRRSPNDPLWIVEALAVVDGAGRPRPGRELVRGTSCRRGAFIVDPHEHGAELEVPPPHPLLGRITDAAQGLSHRLTGEVWIDDDDRVRRVSWTRVIARRPRSPWKPPPSRLWHTTELWDFGVAADIEIPTPQPDEKVRVAEVVGAMRWLWRRKRAYERARSAR